MNAVIIETVEDLEIRYSIILSGSSGARMWERGGEGGHGNWAGMGERGGEGGIAGVRYGGEVW